MGSQSQGFLVQMLQMYSSQPHMMVRSEASLLEAQRQPDTCHAKE